MLKSKVNRIIKSFFLPFVLSFFMIAFVPFYSYSTHIVGGDLNYKYLGNNQYEIRLTVLRDCYTGVPPFDDPAVLGIFDASNNLINTLYLSFLGLDTVPLTMNNPCFVPPIDVCYEITTYVTTLSLPPFAGGYQLAYQRCCRNYSILNIIDPDTTGGTYYASIPDISIVDTNSNPVFNAWPPPFLCVNVPFSFDHSAFDYEGDSLVYELFNPLDGANIGNPKPDPPYNPPYGSVVWRSPYSLNNMLGGVPLTIDPQTGLITLTPNTIGNFVVGIKVKEYRNGILIGETLRDFQWNVVDCLKIVVASIQSQLVNCDKFTVQFVNNSVGAVSYFWDFGDLSTLSDTSNLANPLYTYPDTVTYNNVMLIVYSINPNCNDTSYQVRTYPTLPIANAGTDVTICQGTNTTLNASGAAGGGYTWSPTTGLSDPNIANPTANPNSTTIYVVTVTDINGCQDIDSVTVTVVPSPTADAGPDVTICQGDSTTLTASGGTGFLWSTGETTASITVTPISTTTYSVTVSDSACSDIDSVTVTLNSLPVVVLTGNNIICVGDNTTLTVSGGISYLWNTGDTTQSITVSPSGDSTYSVEAFNSCGSSADSITITVNPLPNANAGNDTSIVLGSSLQLSGSGGTLYSWSPSTGLSCTNCQNPVADPTETITYTLTVTDVNGCVNTDTITIFIDRTTMIFIPDIFSPNGDDKNDVFYVDGKGIKELILIIYDRWGERVFETNCCCSESCGWNGTFKGKPLNSAVFVYYLKGIFITDEEIIEKGNITLLR
ncbi:MAG: gliding motility-associated C-terminal domain-containing protein [Bacteroidetes bacterium]|nr:gliding motility-associated C-terminal domain-containing protein [Bacteroidota bacterium]